MKVLKIFSRSIKPQQTAKPKNSIPPCPIIYDKNNVTAEEFKKYIQWLSENNINRTFQEPDGFITEAERATLEKKTLELKEFRDYLKFLSENNINKTFYC